MRGSDSDASMTAFSLIAIQEARPICEDVVSVSIILVPVALFDLLENRKCKCLFSLVK